MVMQAVGAMGQIRWSQ